MKTPYGKILLVVVALAGLSILFWLDSVLESSFQSDLRKGRDLACQQFKQTIEDFFSVRFGALLALKSFYESSDDIRPDQFQAFCSRLWKEIPNYRAIAFVDNNFFISEIFPRKGNEKLVGLSMKEPAAINGPFRQAIREQRLTIGSAVNLRNVGIGLLANLPVFRKDRLAGVVLGIFDFSEIVEKSVGQEWKERFYFRLLDPQDRIISVGPGEFPADYSEAQVRIGNSSWKLLLAFKKGEEGPMSTARRILWFGGIPILILLVLSLGLLSGKNTTLERINAQLEKANDRIREFEIKKQELFLQRMSDGILVVDADCKITLINPAASRMLEKGSRREVRLGERVLTYLESFECSIPPENIFYAKEPLVFELCLKEADSVTFSGVASALTDVLENRVGTVVTLRNITAYKRLERLKTEFVSQVSHKLNTPLTVIQNNLELMSEGGLGALNEKQRELVEKTRQRSRELTHLVGRLLDFTRIEEQTLKMNLNRSVCYLEDVIAQALSQMNEEFQEKQVALEKTMMSGLTLQGGDNERLTQMLIQILENAVKFNPPGTRIRLATSLSGGRVQIEVSDNGVGIAPEQLPLIFDPFYQIDKDFTGKVRGAGLGLSIAKQIARAHDGDISVQSELGKGSTFKILLPYC